MSGQAMAAKGLLGKRKTKPRRAESIMCSAVTKEVKRLKAEASLVPDVATSFPGKSFAKFDGRRLLVTDGTTGVQARGCPECFLENTGQGRFLNFCTVHRFPKKPFTWLPKSARVKGQLYFTKIDDPPLA